MPWSFVKSSGINEMKVCVYVFVSKIPKSITFFTFYLFLS